MKCKAISCHDITHLPRSTKKNKTKTRNTVPTSIRYATDIGVADEHQITQHLPNKLIPQNINNKKNGRTELDAEHACVQTELSKLQIQTTKYVQTK